MRRVIYIAHPFGGKPENVFSVEAIIRDLIREYPDYTFYSPIHSTGFYYFEKSYDEGMKDCLEMLRRSDELWLCPKWETSKGCNIEHQFAKDNSIPIKYIGVE